MAEHVYRLEKEQTELVSINLETGKKIVIFDQLDPKFAFNLLAEMQMAYFQGRFDANMTLGSGLGQPKKKFL